MDEMMTDTNSGLGIRATDNSPKDGDDFQLSAQVNRPLTDEEIFEKIKEVVG